MKKRLSLLLLTCSLAFAEYRPIELHKTGMIHGLVVFPHETPSPMMIANSKDPHCPPGIGQNHLIVRQENKGLKNVLVILDIPEGKPLSLGKAELRSDHCTFEPRLQWVPLGTSLLIKNNDPTLMNVHVTLSGNTAFTVDLPAGARPVWRPVVHLGLNRVDSDDHLWMRGWIYVSEHPYVTLTDGFGQFTLADVPPGRYPLRVWHEGWVSKGKDRDGRLQFQPMEQTQDVTVRARKTTEITFDSLSPTFFN